MKNKNIYLTTAAALISAALFGQSPFIPDDFADEPSQTAHTFWESHGQILDSEGIPVEDLRYYTIGTGPKLFVFDDKVSFAHYYSDTTLAEDTAWRIDLQFVCNPDEYPDPDEVGESEPAHCGILSAHEKESAYLNYYLPHTGPGLENVEGYHRVVYEDVWPYTDFHLYSNRISLKVYIVVRPGGDPDDILLKFSGQDQITTPFPNEVRMHLSNKSMSLPQAFAWQDVSGTPTALGWLPTWNLVGQNNDMVNMTTGSYNTSEPLIIQIGGDPGDQGLETDDPNDNIHWSTYYGDNKSDNGSAVDTDPQGRFLVSGTTSSAEFPLQNGQSTYEAQLADVFVTRFNQGTKSMLWSSFCGGTGNDVSYDLDHNDNGKIYVVGETSSETMVPPTPFVNEGNYQQTSHGDPYDGFLLRFNNNGFLKWVTHFGGEGEERIYSVVGDADHVYITGTTSSSGSQTCAVASGNELSLCDGGGSAYFQSTFGGGGNDAFFAQFNNAGDLTHSSYIGGNGYDVAFSIGLSHDEKLVITGRTNSGNVPSNVSSPCGVPGSGEFPLCDYGNGAYFQDDNPTGFILRFNDNLETEWGTFFGYQSSIGDFDFNSSNDLIIVGSVNLGNATTNTCNAPTTNSFPVCATALEYSETYAGDSIGRKNFFIARFTEDGHLSWSTPYGEWSNVKASAVSVDDDDNIYVLGDLLNDPSFPPNGNFPGLYFPGYYQQWGVGNHDSLDRDLMIVAFDDSNERQWATLLGGEQASGPNAWQRNEYSQDIVAAGNEEIIITGSTPSLDYYLACPPTSFCQLALSDLSQDGFVTALNIEWLVTEIEEARAHHQEILIYPNPAGDMLSVQLGNDASDVELSVLALDGRLIWNSSNIISNGAVQIPTHYLAPGVYILKVNQSGKIHTAKFVKQ
ncbi:MAG: T9SS type A sorting domain-containing protein [Salibacteraceae bacterium]